MSLTRLFCDADDFCQHFFPEWEKAQIENGETKKRHRQRSLSPSEVMTIVVFYHQSGYKTFKWFYERCICQQWRSAFPGVVSYNRFIEFLPDILMPLTCFMQTRCSEGKGIAFIDSTLLWVCENLRIPRHETFKNEAGEAKAQMVLRALVALAHIKTPKYLRLAQDERLSFLLGSLLLKADMNYDGYI